MHKGHKTGRDTGPYTLEQATKLAKEKNELDKKNKSIKIRKKDFWAGID